MGTATVIAARDGDQRALDALVAEHLPLVYNIVGRALQGHADVDDVVQETMLRVVDGLPRLREPDSFRSWRSPSPCTRSGTGTGPATAGAAGRRLGRPDRHRGPRRRLRRPRDHPAAAVRAAPGGRRGDPLARRRRPGAARRCGGWRPPGARARARSSRRCGSAKQHAAVRIQRMKAPARRGPRGGAGAGRAAAAAPS